VLCLMEVLERHNRVAPELAGNSKSVRTAWSKPSNLRFVEFSRSACKSPPSASAMECCFMTRSTIRNESSKRLKLWLGEVITDLALYLYRILG
jgi:hypothetical protein